MKAKNLIIITCDEMRGDAPGFMGNSDCLTPNIDNFAEKGIVFNQHFAVHGKCVPSRISMMTGRYSHTDGYRTITQHMPKDQPHLVGKLKEHNYETAVFGLNHVWEDFYGDNSKSSGYVDYHSFTQKHFDFINDKKWPVAQPGPNSREPMDLEAGYHYQGRIEEDLTGHDDVNRAEQAVHYLGEVRDKSRPFYMQLNLSRPHPPYAVEEPYFSMYDRDKITPWPYQLPENAPLPLRKMREIRTGIEEPEEYFRELQAVYYGMITKVDSLVGKVINSIKEQGLLEDTIVIFTADHGDFAGQYGLPEKWDTAMQDCILHVPLIIHAPGLKKGWSIDSMTQHIDLAPTILELLGIKADWGIHGENLLPVIKGEKRKSAIFADGGHEEEMWPRFNFEPKAKRCGKQDTYRYCPETMSRTKMVRTDEWKLVMRLTGGNELYNMKNDPDELQNLYGDLQYNDIVLDLQQKMIEWCLKTDTDRPFQPNVGA